MTQLDPVIKDVARAAHDRLAQLAWVQGFNFGVAAPGSDDWGLESVEGVGRVRSYDHVDDIPEGHTISCCCLEGALLLAVKDLDLGDDVNHDSVLNEVGQVLFERGLLEPELGVTTGTACWNWNDKDNRTKEEVLDLLAELGGVTP